MTIRRAALASAAVISFSLAASLARAQGTEKDADAERLFNEAKKLMEERKFADACPKLESAYRKDQQHGTLLNLAYCHKEAGSGWLAWTEFREAEAKATEKQRKDFAREKMKEIEKTLGKVVVDPQTKYELTEVILEDRRIYDAEKGTPFFAEPGQRKAIFHAKGKKPAILLISVGAPKEKMLHIQVPEMADEDPIAPAPADTSPAPISRPAPSEEPRSSWSGQKTLAVIAGAAGIGGLAVGGIFGAMTISSDCADGKPEQGGQHCTDQELSNTEQEATISTIGFIAGGALVVGAVVLWVTAPSSKSGSIPASTVTAGFGPSWMGLRGTF